MYSGHEDVRKVIYEACERLGITNSDAYELRFLSLIVDAEKKIGTGNISGVISSVYHPGSNEFIQDKKILIPHEMLSDLEVLDKDSCPIDTCDYFIRGAFVVFKEVQTEVVILRYKGLLLDFEEQPYIATNHVEAVVSYLVYMETTTRYHSKKAAYYEFRDAREWWQDRLAEARGNDLFSNEQQFTEAGEELHSITRVYHCDNKVKYQSSGNTVTPSNEDVYYGILDLADSIVNAEDYTTSILNPEIETTKTELSSNNFTLNATKVGRLTVVVPYASGTITSLIDGANNDIFSNYFDIIDDGTRDIRIYVAKNFITIGNYKLTFGFSN